MSSMPYNLGVPVYDNSVYARGCDSFVLKAETPAKLHKLLLEVAADLPDTFMIKGHLIGQHPDKPVPRPMWFMEVAVRDKKDQVGALMFGWDFYIEGGKTCSELES